MPLYMTQFSYTREAVAAMTKDPQDRGAVLKQLVEKLGGRMIGIWYCLGEYDGVVIAEVPDHTTELAMILTAVSPGHVKATKTTQLLTMEDAVEAMKKASKLTYAGVGAENLIRLRIVVHSLDL